MVSGKSQQSTDDCDVQTLIDNAPSIREAYDTSTTRFRSYLNQVKHWYSNQDKNYTTIDDEVRSANEPEKALGFRVALKIAESHRILCTRKEPLTITLINPVYKETTRMLPRDQHPHGEDSIRFKMRALETLESLCPGLFCRFFVIDDGCPEGSGAMAMRILDEEFPAAVACKKSRVYFLSDAIDQNDPDLPPGLTHKDGPNHSVKGGATLLGMRKALNDDSVTGHHIIIDNDADLSVHPEQIGLLIEPILLNQAEAVAGTRRNDDSAALIGGSRNIRGRLFIQVLQHLLPDLSRRINDTNRAFKAFTSTGLERIIDRISIYTFPYQIELLQACISEGIPLTRRGIAYIDSEAASTQQGDSITETYLHQVQLVADIARRYQTIDPTDPLLIFLDNISEDDWLAIERNPPEDLSSLLARPGQ